MREYMLRVRQHGETFAATIREYAPTAHPEVRAVLGPVSRGLGATAPAAMLAAIAAHHVPDAPATFESKRWLLMPFVITTKRPRGACCRGSASGLCSWHRDYANGVSRRAVATLEEAQQAAWDGCLGFDQVARDAAYSQLTDLGRESGGTVGPLPDGTVIEVEPRAWYKLAIDVHMLPAWQQGADTDYVRTVKAEIIAAYNAREGQDGV